MPLHRSEQPTVHTQNQLAFTKASSGLLPMALKSTATMSLSVLIVGAGICGPAFAMLLQKSNSAHKITVVERSPTLRAAGQQIDLKLQAPHLMRKMGLLDEINLRSVNERGLEFVDSQGSQTIFFGVASADQPRRLGLTSEHEILRGDLVQVLYDASVKQDAALRRLKGHKGKLEYIFGQTITALNQDANGVNVTFTDGHEDRYDLVIGADGQRSRTRHLAFGREVSDASFNSLGIHGAYFSIPHTDKDGNFAQFYLAPGSRWAIARPSNESATGILLYTTTQSENIKASYGQSVKNQKAAFAEVFKDIEWQRKRLLDGLANSEDFYAHELGQIKMQTLHNGRVVLLGDAGYGPSPFTGMGTNLCLIGAYLLAGELARNSDDIRGALLSYEKNMWPFIHDFQRLPRSALSLSFPSSRLGVWVLRKFIWVMSIVTNLWPQTNREDNSWERLPDYPELKLQI